MEAFIFIPELLTDGLCLYRHWKIKTVWRFEIIREVKALFERESLAQDFSISKVSKLTMDHIVYKSNYVI